MALNNFIRKMYVWFENNNLLTEDGSDKLNYSENIKIENADLLPTAKKILDNYYDRILECKSIDINHITQKEVNNILNERLNDLKNINRSMTFSESNYPKDDYKNIDMYSYMESIKYNIPKDTSCLDIKTEYHNNHLAVTGCVAYTENGLIIKSEGLNAVSKNPNFYKMFVRESDSRDDIIKNIMRGMKIFKESWQGYNNDLNMPVRLVFDELKIATMLHK